MMAPGDSRLRIGRYCRSFERPLHKPPELCACPCELDVLHTFSFGIGVNVRSSSRDPPRSHELGVPGVFRSNPVFEIPVQRDLTDTSV